MQVLVETPRRGLPSIPSELQVVLGSIVCAWLPPLEREEAGTVYLLCSIKPDTPLRLETPAPCVWAHTSVHRYDFTPFR